MYRLYGETEEFDTIQDLIDHVTENGIDPSSEVEHQILDYSGGSKVVEKWYPIGEVMEFIIE